MDKDFKYKDHGDIYKLDLHESTQITLDWIGDYADTIASVIRVPGGWIYVIKDHHTFVPYKNDFLTK